MPITKGVLELMNESPLAAATTVPASPGGDECSIVTLADVSQCSFEFEAVFDADGTADAVFHVRASTTGGTEPSEWDTQDYASGTLACVAGLRAQMTLHVDPSPPFLTVLAENKDGTYTLTDVKVTRAIQQIEAL